jgi:hypothetical protein
MLTDFNTFQATGTGFRVYGNGMFVPRQVYPSDNMAGAFLNAFPACFAFPLIEKNIPGTGIVP